MSKRKTQDGPSSSYPAEGWALTETPTGMNSTHRIQREWYGDGNYCTMYSQKYWRKLHVNLAVEPKITITRILVDFNLGSSVWDRHIQVGNFGGF